MTFTVLKYLKKIKPNYLSDNDVEQYFERILVHRKYVSVTAKVVGNITKEQIDGHDRNLFEHKFFFPFLIKDIFGDHNSEINALEHHYAMNMHYFRNKYTWQHWFVGPTITYNPSGHIKNGCLPMPLKYINELAADALAKSLDDNDNYECADSLKIMIHSIRMHPNSFELFKSKMIKIEPKNKIAFELE